MPSVTEQDKSRAVAPVRVGIIGCGSVSFQYFEGCRRWDALDLVACADIEIERSQAKAAEYVVATRVVQVAVHRRLLSRPAIGGSCNVAAH